MKHGNSQVGIVLCYGSYSLAKVLIQDSYPLSLSTILNVAHIIARILQDTTFGIPVALGLRTRM